MRKPLIPSLLMLLACAPFPLTAQTIAEKKASLQRSSGDIDHKTQQKLSLFNQEINEKKDLLRQLYSEAQSASPEDFERLRHQIASLKQEIASIEMEWQEVASKSTETEAYALWHQPETSLEELIIDYGSQDYVYLIPPAVSAIKISVNSNIPIPRAAWSSMLESILTQNGVGIRQVTPFLRELYLLKDAKANVNTITNKVNELELYPPDQRVAFLLTPEPEDVRRTFYFLEKFANPQTTSLEQVGRDILIVANASEIQELLKMNNFISANRTKKDYKMVSLSKVKAEDMAKILSTMFDQVNQKEKGSSTPVKGKKDEDIDTNGLKIVVLDKLSQGIFLVGTREEINRAEKMIKEIETQFAGAREKTIFWYTVKHSTAEDLATTLQQIYSAMVRERVGRENEPRDSVEIINNLAQPMENPNAPRVMTEIGRDSFYMDGAVAVDPAPVTLVPERKPKQQVSNNENFIVDPKTGSIVMVVERDLLPKMKEVIKKLDVPKKMVQIEVLLFEKRTTDRTRMGLNLLRMGGCASQTNSSCLRWNDPDFSSSQTGILDFLLSRVKNNGIPAFDLAYRFLISQDDVNINANPSVVTINQVPAKVAILEERSINTGINFIETTGTATPRDSFTRAQYGITMEITPTIHMTEDNDWIQDDQDYITLDTTVNFDTFQQDTIQTDRPIVTRRNIHNEVLIPDGQTVILGGLRRKDTQDTKDKIPYLGEIPGFGKFFSTTSLTDTSVEMFIFITPRIIKDPEQDLQKVKCEQMCRRPGDIPDFLCMLNESRKRERNQLMAGTIKMLFGPGGSCYFPTKEGVCTEPCFSEYRSRWETTPRQCEYDGR